MSTDPLWSLPLLVEGQASGEATHNDAIVRLAWLVRPTVQDDSLTAPPGGESNGEAWLVQATATGDWAGEDNNFALYYNGWIFITPLEGMTYYDETDDKWFLYKAAAWVELTVP